MKFKLRPMIQYIVARHRRVLPGNQVVIKWEIGE